MIDYHLHTSFSKDSKENIYDICFAAHKKGLKYIAVTDHLDYDDLLSENWEIKDITGEKGYLAEIKRMQGLFPNLNIAIGVEAGYTPSGNNRIIEKIKLIKPDFVIGSVHFIDGIDIYHSEFFDGKTKSQAYNEYLEKVLESIYPLSKYSNIIGHLTYISKSPNVPYKDPAVHYTEHKDIIDEILKNIIDLRLGIEINTSGLLRKVNCMLPDLEIVKRYKELGGEILTIGSDAHLAKYVGTGISNAFDVAREAGLKYITIFPNGEKKQIKI